VKFKHPNDQESLLRITTLSKCHDSLHKILIERKIKLDQVSSNEVKYNKRLFKS